MTEQENAESRAAHGDSKDASSEDESGPQEPAKMMSRAEEAKQALEQERTKTLLHRIIEEYPDSTEATRAREELQALGTDRDVIDGSEATSKEDHFSALRLVAMAYWGFAYLSVFVGLAAAALYFGEGHVTVGFAAIVATVLAYVAFIATSELIKVFLSIEKHVRRAAVAVGDRAP